MGGFRFVMQSCTPPPAWRCFLTLDGHFESSSQSAEALDIHPSWSTCIHSTVTLRCVFRYLLIKSSRVSQVVLTTTWSKEERWSLCASREPGTSPSSSSLFSGTALWVRRTSNIYTKNTFESGFKVHFRLLGMWSATQSSTTSRHCQLYDCPISR